MEIILASASPRRAVLLHRIAGKISVMPAHIDERVHASEKFSEACVRLAIAKARKIARREKNAVVVGADTIAYLGRKNCRKTDLKSNQLPYHSQKQNGK